MNRLDKISFIKDHLKCYEREDLENIVYDLIDEISDDDLDRHILYIIENYYNLDLKEILGDKE